MTNSFTRTESWSRTYARYVAGKVAADLRQMLQEYGEHGRLSDSGIDEYMEELTTLLAGGFVERVTYGFKRDEVWIAALRYSAAMDGTLTADDRSGRIPRGEDISGAEFSSYLVHSAKWYALSSAERATIEQALPFSRAGREEPSVGAGLWATDSTYSSHGNGVRRSTIGGTR